MSDDFINAAISVAYPIEHIAVRGRVAKLTWQKEVVPVLIRTCPARELNAAFVIERKATSPFRVLTQDETLLWPVGSGVCHTGEFLRALHDGYPGVVGLVAARLRGDCYWHMETDVRSREVIHSWRDDVIARTHRAADNIVLVDGHWPHVGGGGPALMGGKIFNTGAEFGRPQPIALTDHKGAYWLDEFNLRSNVASGFTVAADKPWQPASGDGDQIRCFASLPPIDVAGLQLQILCRDLLEIVENSHHLPLDVRRNGFSLHRLHHSTPSFEDCVDAIIEVRSWVAGLGPDLRNNFRDASRLLKSRIPLIDRTLHREGRPRAFAIEPSDDDAVARLFVA